MKVKAFLAGLFLLALLLLTAPYALGCTPDEDNPGRCLLFVKPSVTTVVQVAAVAPATSAPPAPAAPAPRPTPNGNGPQTARSPMYVKPEYCIEAMCPGAIGAPPLNAPGNWDWVAPNSSLWYGIEDRYGLQIQMWLLANGQQGIALDVYAPDQQDLYGKPIGRGSLNRNFPGVDLFYSGRTQVGGTWYARVTNNNSIPVSFSLRYSRTTPSLGNNCDNCHKSLGYDWNACPDPAFCGKLHDYLDTNPQCYDHNIEADLAGNCKQP